MNPKPTLYFTPYAWAKLLALRDFGDTEVSGMGITPPNQPMVVADIQMIKQECDAAYTEFDDEGISNFFEDMVDQGYHPSQFGRVWIHTHPGNCAKPSTTDETTFKEVFGRCDHAVMMILAKGGDIYARLGVEKPISIKLEMDVRIDYTLEFPGTNREAWKKEYDDNVTKKLHAHVQTYVNGNWQSGKYTVSNASNNNSTGNWQGYQRGWDGIDGDDEEQQTSVLGPDAQKAASMQAYKMMTVPEFAEEYCSAYYSNDIEAIAMLDEVLKDRGKTFHDSVMDTIAIQYGDLDARESEKIVGG